jgi:CheY-like chemotaxis protein
VVVSDEHRRTRVLIVDDVAEVANGLRNGLSRLGYDVKVALDAEAALDMAQSFQPDIALIDIVLPGMSGYELARRLKKNRTLCIVGMSGNASDPRVESPIFEERFLKPFDLESMHDAFLKLLVAN